MKNIIALFVLLLALNANADNKTPVTELMEIDGRDIVLSNDGTGIVKNIECKSCSSNVLMITKNTKAFENKQPVDLVSSRNRFRNKVFMLRYDIKTREVLVIRW